MLGQVARNLDARRFHAGAAGAEKYGGEFGYQRLDVASLRGVASGNFFAQTPHEFGGVSIGAGVAGDYHDGNGLHGSTTRPKSAENVARMSRIIANGI